MERTKHDSPIIETYRTLTEEHLLLLLRDAKNPRTLDEVRKLIFEAGAADFRAYVKAMLAMFDINELDESALQVIQDAWNYFPHQFLNGQCPAEFMMQRMHDAE